MAGVVLENVSRVFPGQVAAVRAVSLEVRDREFLVLVGPSGCGKSTTLRLVAGLEELSSGTITIGTRIVNDVPPKDRDIAMVFQNYALYPHLSVYRNMAFGLELREGINSWSWLWRWALPPGRKRAMAQRRYEVAERVQAAARTLGIEKLLERYPRQLSGGERQRVALGRAMVRSPAVFLFDEPLSNLDAKLRVEMRRELKELHRRLQTTMIFVTHDQVEALTLGQRIVVMNEGAIQQVGRPMELYDWPANRFVAGFIGTPAMNFVDGTLVRNSGSRQFRRGGLAVDLGGRRLDQAPSGENLPAVLGVRPEDVRIGGRTISDRERPGSTARGTVRLVESLGDATVVTVSVDEVAVEEREQSEFEVLIKTDARSELRTGDAVSVTVDAGRVHVFDPDTGQNWACPSAVESQSETD